MRLRDLLIASAALVVAFSCGGTKEEPTPQPEPQKQQITIPAESQAVFNSGLNLTSGNTGGGGSTGQAQTSTVKFTAPASWSADVNDTRSSTWLSVQPSSGGAGDVTMTVTAQPNTGTESRSATVTIKCGTNTKTFSVTQAGSPPTVVAVTSVTLNKAELNLEPGGTETLTATVAPENATDKTVTWSTSNAEVATVADGKVTAVKEGEATIMAKAGEESSTCKVTVKKGVVAVSSVTLNKNSLSLTKGQSEKLIATVLPDNATDKTVTWSSTDESVASVDQTGNVVAKKTGTATITAKAGEKDATCSVTVTTPVEGVSLDRSSISLEIGQSTTLVATISPNDADEKTVEWSTSSASVATVADGVVTAVAEGTATITASVGGKSATCAVTVKKSIVAVTSVTLNKGTLSLTKGQTETLTATVNPDNATDKTVTWSSSDATKASVTQNGLVTALKSGKVTITAKAGEKSATCEVTITTPVESVSLNKTSLDLEEGKTFTLVATINPSDADDQTVEWSTSNGAIATVSNNGVVTAVKEGEATITAKVGEKTATCKVVVKPSGLDTGDPEGFEDGGEEEW